MSKYIYSTKNYDKFNSNLEGNRNIDQANVNRLKKSFSEKYLFSPILVNRNFEIIDGQNRFTAAKELGLTINYIVVNDYGVEEVKILNTNKANWLKKSFFESYCKMGKIEYLKLEKYINHFSDKFYNISVVKNSRRHPWLTLSKALQIIDSGKHYELDGKKDFENGEFIFENEKSVYEITDKLNDIFEKISDFQPAKGKHLTKLLISTIKHPNYNHERLLKKLVEGNHHFTKSTIYEDYEIALNKIYNNKLEKTSKYYIPFKDYS